MGNPQINPRRHRIPPLRPLAILLYCCAGIALVLAYVALDKSRGFVAVLGLVTVGFFLTGLGFHMLSLWITRLHRDQEQS
jgi:hypothetical protein